MLILQSLEPEDRKETYSALSTQHSALSTLPPHSALSTLTDQVLGEFIFRLKKLIFRCYLIFISKTYQ